MKHVMVVVVCSAVVEVVEVVVRAAVVDVDASSSGSSAAVVDVASVDLVEGTCVAGSSAAVVDVASVGMRVGILVGGRRSDGRELGVQIDGILVLTGVGGNEGYVVGVNVSSGRLGGVILPKEFWRGQCVQTPVGLSHWQPAARHIAALTYSGQSSARTNS
jgi:hypothetical protein